MEEFEPRWQVLHAGERKAGSAGGEIEHGAFDGWGLPVDQNLAVRRNQAPGLGAKPPALIGHVLVGHLRTWEEISAARRGLGLRHNRRVQRVILTCHPKTSLSWSINGPSSAHLWSPPPATISSKLHTSAAKCSACTHVSSRKKTPAGLHNTSAHVPDRLRSGTHRLIGTCRRYLTLTYFRSTRGRGSPAKILPNLSTVPNSGPLPVRELGRPP